MRWQSLAIGIAILAFGVYLVSSHGYLGGTYIPGLVGLPSGSGTNSTTPGFPGVAGYSVGTIIAISGLGMIMNSLRSASMQPSGIPGLTGMSETRGVTGAPGSMPPEMIAVLAAMQAQRTAGQVSPTTPGPAPGPAPGVVYCSKCGRSNVQDAKFCHECGATMPVTPPAAPPS
jgi:hypothetical protein